MYAASRALGGVPMSVAIPPVVAPYATASSSAVPKSRSSRVRLGVPGKRCTTDSAIGSIISDVAVLLTHMLTSAEASRNPAMIDAGRVPSIPMRPIATRRCRCQRCIPSAMTNPPRNRKMIGLANGAALSRMSLRPRAGKSTSGRRAVAKMGIGSAIQNAAMKSPTPAVCQPLTLRPSGGDRSSVSRSAVGPTTHPIRCRRPYPGGMSCSLRVPSVIRPALREAPAPRQNTVTVSPILVGNGNQPPAPSGWRTPAPVRPSGAGASVRNCRSAGQARYRPSVNFRLPRIFLVGLGYSISMHVVDTAGNVPGQDVRRPHAREQLSQRLQCDDISASLLHVR